VKSSTITTGYDVGMTNIIKVHHVMMKALGANLTNGIKIFNHVCNKLLIIYIYIYIYIY